MQGLRDEIRARLEGKHHSLCPGGVCDLKQMARELTVANNQPETNEDDESYVQ